MAQRFGRYWLHEKIGHGGMAEVFRATMGPRPDQSAFELAVKCLHLQLERDPVQRDMFLTEADVAKLLRHPNVLTVYEAGTIEGRAYITMEYMDGHDIGQLLQLLRRKRLRFPSDLAVFVTMAVLRALDYVHEARSSAGQPMHIVHRDVTPQNIYINYGGQVKLGDFGVARVSFLEANDDPVVKGKVKYMPPEVLMGEPVEQTMDLWGLAATLYEMVTGKLAVDESEDTLMGGDFKIRIEPAHRVNPDLDVQLSKILQRALHPKPHKRPQSAAQFYKLLKSYLVDQGIQVNQDALSRFMRNVSGAGQSYVERRTQPTASDFDSPSYQVPMEVTPTQRVLITPRIRLSWSPLAVFAGVLLLGMGGLWLVLSLGEGRKSITEQAAAWEVEPANLDSGGPNEAPELDEDAEAQQGSADGRRSFEELEEADEPVVEFGDNLGQGFAVGTLGSEDSRYRALMHRGRVQVKRRRYASAAKAFAEAAEVRPSSITAILAQANAMLALGKHQHAEVLVKNALALEPKNPRAHLLLGDVLWAAGKDKAAKVAYRRCVDLDPKGSAGQLAKKVLENL